MKFGQIILSMGQEGVEEQNGLSTMYERINPKNAGTALNIIPTKAKGRGGDSKFISK
jgi:hypothetical protein